MSLITILSIPGLITVFLALCLIIAVADTGH
jgi:UPF0716 family protein affecting phage T7 exclusion